MLVLNAEEVRRALPVAAAVTAMREAFGALSAGRARMPDRAHLAVEPHEGASLVMPAYVDGDRPALTVKVVSLFARNRDRGLPRIQSAVLVLEPETGRPLALLEGATLTAIRTAAASALATDLLARPDARTLAVFGAGVQARAHLEAMPTVRAFQETRVYAPTRAHADALAAAGVHVAASPGEAVHDADVICTTTTSASPVFDDADLKPGVHINAVGSYTPGAAEVPGATVARARVVVDSRDAAWQEAGDLIQPLRAGLITREHVHAELGELVGGAVPARGSPDEITLFKSVGVAVQDAVAAAATLARAEELGLGQRVDW